MDSINKNQPEHNIENLVTKGAIEKIKELVKKTSTCFFTTMVSSGDSGGTRPMSVQQIDDEGNLWFLSASDSHKNHELGINPSVKLYFQGSPHSDFLVLNGTAVVIYDKAKIKELWQFVIKTWFTEGEDDPRIRIIKFTPTDGYYWDTKHGTAIAGIKMLIGATTGITLDDSVEGTLKNVG